MTAAVAVPAGAERRRPIVTREHSGKPLYLAAARLVGVGSLAYLPSFVSPTALPRLAIMLTLSVRRADLAALDTPLLVLGLPPGATIARALGPVDAALGGALSRTLERPRLSRRTR